MSVERLLEALQQHGPMKAMELCGLIGASQPTLSRLLRSLTGQVLVCGKARATFYAARRAMEGVPERVPVYEVRPVGEPPRISGWVVPAYPQGYALQQADGAHAGFTRD